MSAPANQALNRPQREAVAYIDGPLLVLAGAGSGKTRVITRKIAWLVNECGYAPGTICALTFTNKSAREMKSRVGALPGTGKGQRGLTVSTFHSLGLSLLQREHTRLDYRRGFSIFDAGDSLGLLREISRREGDLEDAVLSRLQWQISDWKAALIPPETAMQAATDDIELRQARLYGEYQRHLKACNAFDFDDLIVRPVELLQQIPEVREYWQNRLRYLLVDEYQDTNGAQYELLRLLAGARAQFTVVGDDDQSIYAWRGARPENIGQLGQDYPGLKVIKLEQNYRSSGRILRVANQLIAGNPHLFEKRLWSQLGEGDPIRVLQCRDSEAEARRIVSEIIQHRFHQRSAFSDFAILYRGNHQARAFEQALRENQIPYRISGGRSFFDKAEVKDLMAYLKLLANPDDNSAFLRIINTPRREIGAATLEKLADWAGGRGVSLLAACTDMGLAQKLPERNLRKVREFADWMADLARLAEHEDTVSLARRILRESDYETWLLDTLREPRQVEKRMEALTELLQWLQKVGAREGFEGRLEQVLAHISLLGILERQEEETEIDGVQLMTLHAAKGLEFPHVFMVGMEEGLLPHHASLDDGALAEERRLCYVGIPRAQRSLTLSWASQRRRAGEQMDCEPSRFLEELPADDLAWERPGKPQDPEKRLATGKAHLDALRNMLAEE